MKGVLFVVGFLALSAVSYGNDQKAYNEGKAAVSGFKNLPDSSDLKDLPGADGNVPQQGYFGNPGVLEEGMTVLLTGDENAEQPELQVAGALKESMKQKPYFVMDENMPEIRYAEEALKEEGDKLEQTKEFSLTKKKFKKTLHTCFEAKKATRFKCQVRKVVPLRRREIPKSFKIVLATYDKWMLLQQNIQSKQQLDGSLITWITHSVNEGKYSRWGFPTGFSTNFSPPQGLTEVKEIKIKNMDLWNGEFSSIGEDQVSSSTFVSRRIGDLWYGVRLLITLEVIYLGDLEAGEAIIENDCEGLESKSDQDICRLVDEKIIERGADTIEGVAIKDPGWVSERTYKCSYPSLNNCGPYREAGCEQVNSECATEVDGKCVEYKQTYKCKTRMGSVQGVDFGEGTPFCMGGNCDDHTWGPNKGFADAVAKLSIFKEMQGEYSLKDPSIFGGKRRECRRACASFLNCCGVGKGWGKIFGVRCDEEEQELADARERRVCVHVGSYCSNRVLGTCLQRKTSFCCFNSKLIRMFQEQGRAQLGLGWGSAENPDCRGLRVDEIQAIDFGALDLREIFGEIMAKGEIMTQNLTSHMETFSKELKGNLQSKTKSFSKGLKLKSKKNQYRVNKRKFENKEGDDEASM